MRTTQLPPYAVETAILLRSTSLSDQQIADEVDVSHSTIYRYRHGNAVPTVAEARRIRNAVDKHTGPVRQQIRRLDDALEDQARRVDALENGGHE